MKRLKQLLAIALLMCPIVISAQTADRQVIASAGGYFTAGDITASVTVGETMVETYDGEVTLTQGFQQTDQLWPLGIELKETDLNLTVFPNPAMDELTIQLDPTSTSDFSISLFDMHGKELRSENVTSSNSHTLNMRDVAAGIYVLRIAIDGEAKVKTLKIEKTF